ncbi:MAG: ATP-dependent DNA helicase RecG [Kiritimatiellia bacterium]
MNEDYVSFGSLANAPVGAVKGVGPSRAVLFARLGIVTVEDLLLALPYRYEDRRVFARIADIQPDVPATLCGEIRVCDWVRPRSGKGYFEAVLDDGSGLLHCRWFGAPYLKNEIKRGGKLIVYGKISLFRGARVMQHPDYETADSSLDDNIHMGRMVPVYRLTEGLGQKTVRRILWDAVSEYAGRLVESLPDEMLERWRLPGLSVALREAHFPTAPEGAEKARFRLVFEEFLCAELVLVVRKIHAERFLTSKPLVPTGRLKEQFIARLPFRRTSAQLRVIDEIENDLQKPHPMHRLLQGDVGSGKTVVAVFAVLTAVESGAQVAVMAPTDVLAAQHHEVFSQYLVPLGLQIERMAGSMPPARRRQILEKLRAGTVDVLVGTHALIQEGVEFRNLGLVIIDEQHKFGVEQRSILCGKGNHPDVLVMTATPIPRTLAMTVYGDLDVSIIDELPGGRQQVITKVITEDQLPLACDFIKKQVAAGRQAFVVFPLVEESESSKRKAAVQMYEKLSATTFAEQRTALVHGQMPSEDKRRVMDRFHAGEIDVLIATTVVEVGLDVPNANVMLVVHAEQYGLSQLHQLRGRIGRGPYKSYCLLQGDPKTKEAWQRLRIMTETTDGFRIAEEDLRIRGMGNLLGAEQSGFPRLRVGDPLADTHILKAARQQAFDIVEEDPLQTGEKYRELYLRARKLYEQVGTFVEVG